MKPLRLAYPGERLSLLCLGAHSDDIEIGVGGTILELIASGVELEVHWCVLSANGLRTKEAKASASAFLDGTQSTNIELGNFKDSCFPYQGLEIKSWVEELRARVDPDVVFTCRLLPPLWIARSSYSLSTSARSAPRTGSTNGHSAAWRAFAAWNAARPNTTPRGSSCARRACIELISN